MKENIIYNLQQIDTIKFESTEMTDFFADTQKGAYRLTVADIAGMPKDTLDIDGLRKKLSDFFVQRLNCNYNMLEARCDIKRDTFQKVLRFKNGRSITYELLAKFCVGVGVSQEEAKELFAMMGHNLSPLNRADYILLCELNNHGDIVEFDEDLRCFGYKSILSKADSLSDVNDDW